MKPKFTDRPLLFSLSAIGGSMLVMWLFLTPIVRLVPYYFGETVKFLGTLLVVMGIGQECFGGLPFSLENRGFGKGLFTAGCAGLICAAGVFLFRYQRPVEFPGLSVLAGFLLCCLAAAVSEEFLFRGLIFHVMKQHYSLWKAIIFSSLLFGMRPLLNLIWAPAAPVTILGQVFLTFLAGIYLCAVYEKTGNLWICVTLHFLENLGSGIWALFVPQPAPDSTVLRVLLLVIVHLICAITAWFLLKTPEKSQK